MEPADRRGPPAIRDLDDRQLVAALAERRQEALGELYDRHAGMLLALGARILGRREDAEEVLQETLLQAWNQAGRYAPERSSVATWLVLIARSRAIDRLRTRRVVERTAEAAHREEHATHASPAGPTAVLEGERRERLQRKLAELPADQREVLEKAFFAGWTQREIAERTGVPLGTVKTRTLLAMKKLRAALADDLEELL
ncbi:MAG: sigma-70 family RNA polymerase sigma factor [Thermoanaerobaculia bacterium]